VLVPLGASRSDSYSSLFLRLLRRCCPSGEEPDEVDRSTKERSVTEFRFASFPPRLWRARRAVKGRDERPDGPPFISNELVLKVRELLSADAGESQERVFPKVPATVGTWSFPERTGGRGATLCAQDVSGGKPRAGDFPEGVNAAAFAISPDGQLAVGIGPDQQGYLYRLAGRDPLIVNGMEPGDLLIIHLWILPE
jgi:hypothetical protein